MIKIEKGSVGALVIEVASMIVGCIIIWPLLDLLICNVFTHSEFVYSVNEHVVKPIIFGSIAGVVFWTIDKVRVNKEKTKK